MSRPKDQSVGALKITRHSSHQRCANGCRGRDGAKMGRDHVSVATWPLGWFCPGCAKEMRTAWANALVNWESEVPEMESQSVFNRSAA